MSITNVSKPTTSLTNPNTRVLSYETFDSNTTTFDTETRTFDQMATIWSNTLLNTDSFFSSRTFPFLLTLPFSQGIGITNIAKL